jgi:hypothetical protein
VGVAGGGRALKARRALGGGADRGARARNTLPRAGSGSFGAASGAAANERIDEATSAREAAHAEAAGAHAALCANAGARGAASRDAAATAACAARRMAATPRVRAPRRAQRARSARVFRDFEILGRRAHISARPYAMAAIMSLKPLPVLPARVAARRGAACRATPVVRASLLKSRPAKVRAPLRAAPRWRQPAPQCRRVASARVAGGAATALRGGRA